MKTMTSRTSQSKNIYQSKVFGALTAGAFAVALPMILMASASAQMFERPYGHNQSNRGQMAVVIKQAEEGMFEKDETSGSASSLLGLGSAGGQSNVTQLICGGSTSGTASTAKANDSCVIINRSKGASVNVGQDSDGNQDANASTEQTQNNTAASEVIESMLNE